MVYEEVTLAKASVSQRQYFEFDRVNYTPLNFERILGSLCSARGTPSPTKVTRLDGLSPKPVEGKDPSI